MSARLPRGLLAALRFLTCLPVLRDREPEREDLGAAASWFPFVGALIGLVIATALAWTSRVDAGLGSVVALLAWIWITGGLHLDGAADLADALGARHHRPDRFFDVLKDPHIGTFGVLAILGVVLLKIASLHALARVSGFSEMLILIPAWTRYGAVVWSQTLQPVAEGTGERFGASAKPFLLWAWGFALTGASVLWAPITLIAALAIVVWWIFLRRRIGGMTGDALGAGIEWCEAGVLLAIVIARAALTSI